MVDLPRRAGPLWKADGRRRPRLERDVDADVVVVGGGISGLTTAVLLARGGADVVVVEAGAVGGGTTGASTAKVTALQSTRLSQVRSAHGDEAAEVYAGAQTAAREWIVGRAEGRDAADVHLEHRDAVTYCSSLDELEQIEAEADAAEVAGLPITVSDVVPELPYPVVRAIRLADQAQLDPRAWCEDLAAELDASPTATVHEGTRVVGFDQRGRQVTTADGHTVRAGHVVVATLLPVTDRGGFFAQAEPSMSYGIAVTLDDPLPTRFPMTYGEGSSPRSLRAAADADGREVLVVGGGGHTVGRNPRTLDEPEQLVAWASQHFPVREVTHRWAAHDLRPIDHLPFAGRADRLPGAPWVMTGFAKWGLTNGTAAAMTVAGRILGDEPRAWDRSFDPRRGRGGTGLKEAARINASVGRELTWGWLRPGASTSPDGPAVGRRHGVPCGAVPTGDPGRDGERDEGTSCRLSLVCTHLGGIVRWDEAARTWDCPLHGSRFDEEGTVVSGPAVRPLHRHDDAPQAPSSPGVR
jgi:glycine/D-amino acid oxidase-like deaminating enzyme